MICSGAVVARRDHRANPDRPQGSDMGTASGLQTLSHARVVVVVLAVMLATLGGITYAPTGAAAADSSTPVQEDGNCPTGYPVKAAMSEEGDRTAYVPDDPFYAAISPAFCFANDVAAASGGYQLHAH